MPSIQDFLLKKLEPLPIEIALSTVSSILNSGLMSEYPKVKILSLTLTFIFLEFIFSSKLFLSISTASSLVFPERSTPLTLMLG
ncbi:hypothetical protein D3C76_762440 [compost metagenome]